MSRRARRQRSKGNPRSEQGGEAVNQRKEAAQPQRRVNPLLDRVHRCGPMPQRSQPFRPQERVGRQSRGARRCADVRSRWFRDRGVFARRGVWTNVSPRQSFRGDCGGMHDSCSLSKAVEFHSRREVVSVSRSRFSGSVPSELTLPAFRVFPLPDSSFTPFTNDTARKDESFNFSAWFSQPPDLSGAGKAGIRTRLATTATHDH